VSAYYATFLGGPLHGKHEEIEGPLAVSYRVPCVPNFSFQALQPEVYDETPAAMLYAHYSLIGPVVADGVMRQLYLYVGRQ
jgi:hypothetical protein